MNGIEFHRSRRFMWAWDRKISAWSDVRNELNGRRKVGETAVYSENADGSQGSPYMPRTFPLGNWLVTGVVPHPDKVKDHYLYPFFISTNAHQAVEVWEVDAAGRYVKATGRMVEDYGYGNHFSDSLTTLGCIRDETEADLRWVVDFIRTAVSDGDQVPFLVVE